MVGRGWIRTRLPGNTFPPPEKQQGDGTAQPGFLACFPKHSSSWENPAVGLFAFEAPAAPALISPFALPPHPLHLSRRSSPTGVPAANAIPGSLISLSLPRRRSAR